MAKLKVYVTYSPEDKAYCDEFVGALRAAGADVWYDEQCAGPGALRHEMMQQLAERPVVILILSRAALASSDVREQCDWARHIDSLKPRRLMLAVLGAPVAVDKFAINLADGFFRVEAWPEVSLSVPEACQRVLRAMGLWAGGNAPGVAVAYRKETYGDLMVIGKALSSRQLYAGAAPYFERATEQQPGSADAWAYLGQCYRLLNQPYRAFEACRHALDIDPRRTDCWNELAIALCDLGQSEEGVRVVQHALTLDPSNAWTWNTLGQALRALKRYDEALAAYERSLALDPANGHTWNWKGVLLYRLKRYQDALTAFERAFAFDSANHYACDNQGNAHRHLGRFDEALAAHRRALDLKPDYLNAWINQGTTLSTMGRHEEAVASYERGKPWDGDHVCAEDLFALATTLRALGRAEEADETEQRARVLDG